MFSIFGKPSSGIPRMTIFEVFSIAFTVHIVGESDTGAERRRYCRLSRTLGTSDTPETAQLLLGVRTVRVAPRITIKRSIRERERK